MLAALGVLTLAIWAWLLLFHHRFWRADQRLPEAAGRSRWPSVIAIVPARNEAATIADCVKAITLQTYAGDLTVVVVDDSSTDGTGDIARAAGGNVRVVSGEQLPPGWSGKLWALETGLRHTNALPGDYVWFTDADIVHAPGVLSDLAGFAEEQRLEMVSLMARLHCSHFWERLLVPAFVFFFQMLYPFPAVNDPASKIAGAAGGCVLLRRDALARIGGIGAIRGALIDDCSLAAAVKRSGGPIWLGLADGTRSLRVSPALRDLWQMVSRTAFTQLRYSALLLAGTLAGLLMTFLGPPLLVISWPIHHNLTACAAGLAAWAIMAGAYWPTLRDYGRTAPETLLLPITAALYGAMTLDSALNYWRGTASNWKGRQYQKGHT
ncbi:glycosyltransferase [Emcibacter sp. SYSU 3D8]|uniref:glycosyltransferase n=1 Tax=Emcibacter sp. SYSU 3D8 TaxID=3133969 RepID=UPI0031FE8014